MSDSHGKAPEVQAPAPQQAVKVVADMPGDSLMREHMQELKDNDGFPSSVGVKEIER